MWSSEFVVELLSQEWSSTELEPELKIHGLVIVQSCDQTLWTLILALSKVLFEVVLLFSSFTLAEETKISHKEFGVARCGNCLLGKCITTSLCNSFLAGDSFTLNLLKALLNENSQVDDHLVGGTFGLKVFEHDGGTEKGDCLINNIFIFIRFRGRACRVTTKGKQRDSACKITLSLAEAGVVGDERCFL